MLKFLNLLATPAYAATWSGDCVQNDVATIKGITCLVENLLEPLPGLIILAALLMLIAAGARLILAGSNPKALAGAWQTFTWAIVGIILLAVAWLILVAIQNFTGAPVTEFSLPN